jgi:hypothetical protein
MIDSILRREGNHSQRAFEASQPGYFAENKNRLNREGPAGRNRGSEKRYCDELCCVILL